MSRVSRIRCSSARDIVDILCSAFQQQSAHTMLRARTGPRHSSEVSYHIHSIIVSWCINTSVSFQLPAFARERNCTTLLTIITDPDNTRIDPFRERFPITATIFLFSRVLPAYPTPSPPSLVEEERERGKKKKKTRDILNKREIEHGTTARTRSAASLCG